MLGNIESKKRSGQQRMRWLDGITDSMDVEQTPGDSGGQRTEELGVLRSMGSQRVEHD